MYPDDYYYNLQDSYPLYYISPRSSNKYDLYQSTLPYYQDVPVTRSKYYADTSYDDPEKFLQDIEREQRERSQPIGHEIRYEDAYNTDSDGTLDETSAAFLNNLMMQQMYQDNLRGKNSPSQYYEQSDYPNTDFSNPDSEDIQVNKWNDVPYDRPVHFDDEEVKELKELPKKQKEGRKNRQRKQRKLKNNEKRSEDVVVFTDRKPVVKDVVESSTSLPIDETRRNTRGQKEEVMMRPATPVRHPFSESILNMLNQQEERKRSPSVYDKIRHILEMEKNEEVSDEWIKFLIFNWTILSLVELKQRSMFFTWNISKTRVGRKFWLIL